MLYREHLQARQGVCQIFSIQWSGRPHGEYSSPLEVINRGTVGVELDESIFDKMDPSLNPRRKMIRGESVSLVDKGREIVFDPRDRYITMTGGDPSQRKGVGVANIQDSAPTQAMIFEGEVAGLEHEFSRSRMGRMG